MLPSGCRNNETDTPCFSDALVKQLDDAVETAIRERNLPGVVAAVRVPGEGEYFTAKGMADLKRGIPRQLDVPFRIASITKTFVGLSVLKLIEEGRLDRSDRLSKFFPEFPNSDGITIRDLLRMRSGIADYTEPGFLKTVYENPLIEYSAQDVINLSAGSAARFEMPDQTSRYCNANYIILGEIVKKTTGNDIGRQISQSILKPLGLNRTFFAGDNELPGNVRGYAWNVEKNEFDDITAIYPGWSGAAGGMVSTVHDLTVFAKALYSTDCLSASSREKRFETVRMADNPEWVRYGEGIMKMGRFWGHSGIIFGFSSEMWYLPEKDATILINVNRLDLDNKSRSFGLFFDITKILFPEYVHMS